MHRATTLSFAVLVAACGSLTDDPRTQLEYNVGIPREEAGRYTVLQLATIKQVQNRDYQNDLQKDQVIRLIKEGRYPNFVIPF